MSKRYKQPIHKETQARTKSGLMSLFWILVGALLAVMVGVFLYLSPLFDGFRKEVDVNPPMEVTPLPPTDTPTEYEFYEILPKREFRTDNTGFGEDPPPAPTTTEADSVPDEITIVEENITYDDPELSETTEKPSTQYIVQVGIYSDAETADHQLTQLAMMGIDAEVERRYDEHNDLQVFRIVSKPTSKAHAQALQKQLRATGFETSLVEKKSP